MAGLKEWLGLIFLGVGGKPRRLFFEKAKRRIAAMAKKATNLVGVMIMINVQHPVFLLGRRSRTGRAMAVLFFQHLRVILRRNVVQAAQMGIAYLGRIGSSIISVPAGIIFAIVVKIFQSMATLCLQNTFAIVLPPYLILRLLQFNFFWIGSAPFAHSLSC